MPTGILVKQFTIIGIISESSTLWPTFRRKLVLTKPAKTVHSCSVVLFCSSKKSNLWATITANGPATKKCRRVIMLRTPDLQIKIIRSYKISENRGLISNHVQAARNYSGLMKCTKLGTFTHKYKHLSIWSIENLLTLRGSLEIAFGISLRGRRVHEKCRLYDQQRPSCSSFAAISCLTWRIWRENFVVMKIPDVEKCEMREWNGKEWSGATFPLIFASKSGVVINVTHLDACCKLGRQG